MVRIDGERLPTGPPSLRVHEVQVEVSPEFCAAWLGGRKSAARNFNPDQRKGYRKAMAGSVRTSGTSQKSVGVVITK